MKDPQANVHGQLEPEHEPAARRYVVALGALDTAAEPSPVVASTAAAAAADAAKLNALWHEGTATGERPGLLTRLRLELGRLLPWRRRRVHGAMIAAINRNIETTRALIDATQTFQAHVVWYAQTIAGISATQRGPAATAEGVEALQRSLAVLSSDWMKHWESLGAREQRYEARMTSLNKTYEGVLEIANLAQQHVHSLHRAVDALAAGRATGATASSASPSAETGAAGAANADAYKYLVFEDRYRGSREEIQRRLAEYIPLFEGASNVIDIGCGRGELLGLLKDRGIDARGIDINDDMVEACRARGLTADRVDALTFLAGQPDASIGGVIAIQVVEHLQPGYLMRMVDLCHQKLKPGAPLVLETINTACWAAFFDSYIRDFTHAHPLHPDTLRYLVQASGFTNVDIRYLAPVAEHDKLPHVKVIHERDATPTVVELVEGLNAHANRLNSQLFTYRDFAIVARR